MTNKTIDPAFDDNAYFRFLPPHLQERYRDSLDDPELTHLTRQISLMELRITTLLENLDRQVLTIEQITADLKMQFPHLAAKDIDALALVVQSYLPENFINHRTFKRMEMLVDKIEKANLDGHIRDADRARRQLFEAIRAGRREGDVWEDIQLAMEQRRRLGEAEARRLAQNESFLRLEQVVLIMRVAIGAFKDSVNKYVSDREIRGYILEDADRVYTERLGVTNNRKTD